MLDFVTSALRVAYLVCIAFVALYACSTLYLILVYVRHLNDQPSPPAPLVKDSVVPKVAVQVPMFNERYVARRVVEAVARLDYPKDRLHIQILDDSIDDTPELIQGRIAELRAEGLHIELIHRVDRSGYKAGALANALEKTDAEFIAIFDADFVPQPDFLQRVMPYFNQRERVGMVQTRWGHLNEDDNILTHSQALAFDGHFGVEQEARCAGEIVMSFNGTGGIWRRQCIEEAGGWQSDTLTEDFDLSYRAQVKDWHMVYVREIVVPGEIPPQMSAYKSQQARWAKGSTQVLLKLAPQVLRSGLSKRNKVLGILQMMQYAIQIAMLAVLLLTPPMILLHAFDHVEVTPFSLLTLSAPILYALGQIALYKVNWWQRMTYLPVLLLLACGMSFNNGLAAITAVLGIQSEFVRTPKFHANQRTAWWTRSQYVGLFSNPKITGEAVLCTYSLVGVGIALIDMPSMAPYLLFYAASYGLIIGWSLWDMWLMRKPARRIEPEAISQPGR